MVLLATLDPGDFVKTPTTQWADIGQAFHFVNPIAVLFSHLFIIFKLYACILCHLEAKEVIFHHLTFSPVITYIYTFKKFTQTWEEYSFIIYNSRLQI